MVLDGEIVAFGADGRPSFNALQNRAQLKSAREIAAAEQATPAVYFCFDVLHFAGVDLRDATYETRRRYLLQCLLPSPHVHLVHSDDDADALYDAALESGFEGIMAKRRDSPYLPGKRSTELVEDQVDAQRRVRRRRVHERQGRPRTAGCAAARVWEGTGKLRYAGHVGTGFDEATLEEIRQRLARLKTAKSPFIEKPPLNGPTTWLKPKLVAEVKFAEWTDAGLLRAPVFLRLRDDIDPQAIKRRAERRPTAAPSQTAARPRADGDAEVERVLQQLEDKRPTLQLAVGAARIKLTHLDRVYWPADRSLDQPALTKRDLLRYLARVSRFMLPHLADRPLTMIRMPEGIDGQRFFQKHWDQARPEFVRTITVFSETKDEKHDYLLCNDLATLLWLAQVGDARISRLALAVPAGPGYEGGDRFLELARRDGALGPELPRLPRVRHRPVHLFGEGGEGRRAGAEREGVREGQGGRLLAAGAPPEHGAGGGGEDLRQDRPPRLRADRAHARLRRRAGSVRDGGAPPAAPAPQGHHHGVERQQADRQDLHRLQHERPREDPERRLFPPGGARGPGVHAADLGGAGEGPSP